MVAVAATAEAVHLLERRLYAGDSPTVCRMTPAGSDPDLLDMRVRMGLIVDIDRRAGVELRGAAKSFRTRSGTVHAVRGIDVSLARGETVALLGPNGAGKSTTIDMILGLTRPDRGTVSTLERTPRKAVDGGLVGAMLQAGALIRDVTVRELIAMTASLYPAALDVDQTLELVGIRDIAQRRTQKLSGGQAQRVRFALAIAADPDLLVLDEPTVGMDVESRRAFWGSMREFAARGKTVLFATHYLEEADAYADRAVLMADGMIVADGSTGAIRALVGSRTIRATLPDHDDRLGDLPGVVNVDRRGDSVVLSCSDSDAAIRALIAEHPEARDIEISGAALEDAFVELTRSNGEPVGAAR
jgi:ABC-2 type transport system ATP-binding protein